MTGRYLPLLRKRVGRSNRDNHAEEEPLLARHGLHLLEQQPQTRQDKKKLRQADKATTSSYHLPGNLGLLQDLTNILETSTVPFIQQPVGYSKDAPMPSTDQSRQESTIPLIQPLESPKDAPIPTTDAQPTTTTARRKISFCKPCQQARAAPDYAARIAALLDKLYCAECRREHSTIFFSASQRKQPDSIRKCIGHEGYFTICPHLKISLADIQKWVPTVGKRRTARCRDSSCLVRGARIKLWHYQEGSIGAVFGWSTPLDNTTGPPWKRCLAKLQHLHQACPAAFCPHLQIAPDELYDWGRWTTSTGLTRTTRTTCCSICHTYISCAPRDEGRWSFFGFGESNPIWMFATASFEGGKGTDLSWVERLSPESYGYFADQDTKYITWCDERECATTSMCSKQLYGSRALY